MVEFGTSSTFREWVRVRVFSVTGLRGYRAARCNKACAVQQSLRGATKPGVPRQGKKVKSRDCALTRWRVI